MSDRCGLLCNHQAHRLSRRTMLGGGAGLFALAQHAEAHSNGSVRDELAKERAPGARGCRRALLVKNATLISMDPNREDLAKGDMLVRDGVIEAIGPDLHAPGALRLEAEGKIVIPGFVDSHRHLWQGLLRNSGPNESLFDYLGRVLFGLGPLLTPDDVYLGNLISSLSALNAGVTTILDWSHIATSSEHTDAAIDALENVGIRGVYAYGANAGVQPPWYTSADPLNASPFPADLFRLKETRFSSNDQLLTLALAAGGPDFASVEVAALEWQLARQADVRITVHSGLGDPSSLVNLHHTLMDRGQVGLGDDTTYVHASQLSDESWQLIRDTGGTVSLSVPVELQMGHGMPVIQKALDFGMKPSLSVDVETNTPSDMFHQMRSCFALHRGLIFAGITPGAPLLARQALEFATINGAIANGLADVTGSLTVGKRADFLMLNARAINVAPVNDPVAAVVLAMDTSNVDAVFVDGSARKWNGQLVGVHVERIVKAAEVARDALFQRAAAYSGSP
jgi:5-methylthioadenosine/S-adenosylhomocysteine deaminase